MYNWHCLWKLYVAMTIRHIVMQLKLLRAKEYDKWIIIWINYFIDMNEWHMNKYNIRLPSACSTYSIFIALFCIQLPQMKATSMQQHTSGFSGTFSFDCKQKICVSRLFSKIPLWHVKTNDFHEFLFQFGVQTIQSGGGEATP